MLKYTIHWELVSIKDLGEEKTQIFAIEQHGEIIYFGNISNTSLSKEIKDFQEVFNISLQDVKLWIGEVIARVPGQTVTRQDIDEVICMLVFQTQTKLNVVCRSAYYGVNSLVVKSKGGIPLQKTVRLDEESRFHNRDRFLNSYLSI